MAPDQDESFLGMHRDDLSDDANRLRFCLFALLVGIGLPLLLRALALSLLKNAATRRSPHQEPNQNDTPNQSQETISHTHSLSQHDAGATKIHLKLFQRLTNIGPYGFPLLIRRKARIGG